MQRCDVATCSTQFRVHSILLLHMYKIFGHKIEEIMRAVIRDIIGVAKSTTCDNTVGLVYCVLCGNSFLMLIPPQ